MDENFKEVYFDLFCPKCKHEKVPGTDDPCNECLTIPARPYSHTPENFEEEDN